jgi:hypothetical protein
MTTNMKIDLLWFEGCPNHHAAKSLLNDVLAEEGVDLPIESIEVPDLETGEKTKFAGSPTIRINGKDVDPDYEDTGDYTPRCRVYFTSEGFKGVPEKVWLVDAVREAISD